MVFLSSCLTEDKRIMKLSDRNKVFLNGYNESCSSYINYVLYLTKCKETYFPNAPYENYGIIISLHTKLNMMCTGYFPEN